MPPTGWEISEPTPVSAASSPIVVVPTPRCAK
jgi:hypothetical protein